MRALLVLAVCQWASLPAPTTAAPPQVHTGKRNSNIGNKSVEFVNVIREDLRRNNDDYALLEERSQPQHPPARPAHPAYPAAPGHPTPRQPYPSSMSPSAAPLHPTPPTPVRAHPPPARAAPMRRFNKQRDEAVNPSEFRSYTRSKLYKNLRLNKLKQLLNKDKVLMRQDDVQPGGENSPRLEDNPEMEEQPQGENQPLAEDQLQAEGTDTTSASPPPTLPTTQSPPPPTSTEPAAPVSPLTVAQTTRHPAPFDDRGGQGGPVLRNGKDYSPSPEQLDMAAARNPEITRIRLKGRLCQRSLMNAEGPTYDARGAVVLAAYRPRSLRARKFPQTRAPRLLLPRCCNCCKKSVLGCM